MTDELIDRDIIEGITNIIGIEASFQFGWYENPKMTVPGIYHVQVFWASTSTSM